MTIEGYVHRTGRNCESSVIRNVMGYFGMDFDEELIFGLDSSIGFMFFQNGYDKIDLVLGKNEIFTGRSLKYLGAKAEMINSLTGSMGFNRIVEDYILKGIPVITRVDNALLPYWKIPLEANYGGYFIVLCGYQEEGSIVFVSDSEYEGLQEITTEELRLARGSKLSPPINPNHEIYILSAPLREPDISKIGPVAVKNAVRNYVASPMNHIGQKGLSLFKKVMEDWPETKKGKISETSKTGEVTTINVLNFQLKQTARFIEGSGTGGSCYRGLYSEFLERLYQYTGSNVYKEGSVYLDESANEWSGIARIFRSTDMDTTLPMIKEMVAEASEKLIKIIDIEKKAFHILRRT